jgi:hypothetical protein
MLLNARTIQPQNTSDARLILLAIEDVTEKEEKEERTHLQILEDMLAKTPAGKPAPMRLSLATRGWWRDCWG